MKKLIMIVATVCAAIVVNAGTVTWSSGSLKLAAGATGGWDTTKSGNTVGITMSVYLLDDDDYSTVSAMSSDKIYEWSLKQTADYTGENKNSSGSLIPSVSVKDTSAPASTKYNAILVTTYTDAKYGDMYMTAATTGTTSGTGVLSKSNIFATTSGPTNGSGWQAVPEPTSGLLLLLGMAGLALRRRRA